MTFKSSILVITIIFIIFAFEVLPLLSTSQCGPQQGIYRSSCRKDTLFKITDRNVKINGDLLTSNFQKGLSYCVRQCVEIDGCMSINYNQNVLNSSNCEILSISKNGTLLLESVSGWNHYEPITMVSFMFSISYHFCILRFICAEEYTFSFMTTNFGTGIPFAASDVSRYRATRIC